MDRKGSQEVWMVIIVAEIPPNILSYSFTSLIIKALCPFFCFFRGINNVSYVYK